MKTALVTGVTRGIGRAILDRLSNDGYFVHGTYKSSSKEAKSLLKDYKDLELYQVDFSNRENTFKFLKELEDSDIDVIVNNAGIIEFQSFEDIDYQSWDEVFEVNLNTPFIISHYLRNNINKGGTIVNIASTDGMTGSFVSLSYSASKAALINVTKSLGNVFGKKNVRVVAIAPGWVGSGMDSPAIKEAMENNPIGRNAEFEEIANTVAMVISKDASFINGTTVVVDGGYTNVDPILKKEAESL